MRTRIRLQHAVLALVLLGSGIRLSADQPGLSRFQNVRTSDAPLRLALASCYDQSPTCRHLIETIDASTTIAMVRIGYCKSISGTSASCLHFMVDSGGFRYLRITMDPALRGETLVAMLGHELQHAVEIVRAPEVTSLETMRTLYSRIGYSRDRYRVQDEWETAEAKQVADAVEGELRQARKSLVQARRCETSRAAEVGGDAPGGQRVLSDSVHRCCC